MSASPIRSSATGPFDVVVSLPSSSHVELSWDAPIYRALFERLGAFARVINYDKRGVGMSDKAGGYASPETRMDDIRAVMDAAGSERAAIFGWSEGVRLTLLFARHVSRSCLGTRRLRRQPGPKSEPGGEGADSARNGCRTRDP